VNRRLIVNADDFGFTRDVNDGIVEAHRRGILTATTLMANGSAFEHAVELSRRNPDLDVGCHLVLVGGESVLKKGRRYPATVSQLVAAVVSGKIHVYDELAAQVRKIQNAGIRLTHLDTHKHTHLLPSVLDAVTRISEEFRIRWVRKPFDDPVAGAPSFVPLRMRAAGHAVRLAHPWFRRKLAARGCRTTDHFAGFQLTGHFGAAELVELLKRLPEGMTEFMCHPGFCTEELRAAPTRLKESRARELAALTAPETRQALDEQGIELVSYREL